MSVNVCNMSVIFPESLSSSNQLIGFSGRNSVESPHDWVRTSLASLKSCNESSTAWRSKAQQGKGRERTGKDTAKSISIYLDPFRLFRQAANCGVKFQMILAGCKHWEQHRDHRATSLRTSLNDSVYISLYRSAWFVWVFLISHDQSKKVENILACDQTQSNISIRTPPSDALPPLKISSNVDAARYQASTVKSSKRASNCGQ